MSVSRVLAAEKFDPARSLPLVITTTTRGGDRALPNSGSIMANQADKRTAGRSPTGGTASNAAPCRHSRLSVTSNRSARSARRRWHPARSVARSARADRAAACCSPRGCVMTGSAVLDTASMWANLWIWSACADGKRSRSKARRLAGQSCGGCMMLPGTHG